MPITQQTVVALNLAATQSALALANVDPLTTQQLAAFPAIPVNAVQVIAALLAANCPLTQVQRNALNASTPGVLNATPMTLTQVQAAFKAAGVSQLTTGQLAALLAAGFGFTGAWAYTPLATDTFHRANEAPLNPANWTNFSVGSGLQVVGSVCEGRDVTGDAELYIGVTVPFNQYASCVLGAAFGNNSEINLYVMSDLVGGGSNTGWQAFFFGNGIGGYSIQLYGNGQLGSFNLPGVPQPGDVLLFQFITPFLNVFYNGALVISAEDDSNESSQDISGIPQAGDNLTGLGIKFSASAADTQVAQFTTGSVKQTVSTLATIAQLQAALTTASVPLTQSQIIALNS
jgi:hypothetical protein